jgi:osmoprotectant transport system substrate-binding protein
MRGIGPRVSKRVAALIGCLLVSAASCTLVDGDTEPITVGAVTFAENQIVAEMYAQTLEDAGVNVNRRFNFQNREALLPDVRSGAVDIAPEYLASLLTALSPDANPSSEPEDNIEQLEPLLNEQGLQLLEPSEANNANALVVDQTTADQLELETVSDLEPVAPELVFGGPPECPERPFCLEGLQEVYNLSFQEFVPLDPGGPLTAAALESGQIDVALLFTTNAVIVDREWVVLEDDRELQTAENITPLVRSDVLANDIEERLNDLSAELTTEVMTELNARVEIDNESFTQVATDFLEENDLTD